MVFLPKLTSQLQHVGIQILAKLLSHSRISPSISAHRHSLSDSAVFGSDCTLPPQVTVGLTFSHAHEIVHSITCTLSQYKQTACSQDSPVGVGAIHPGLGLVLGRSSQKSKVSFISCLYPFKRAIDLLGNRVGIYSPDGVCSWVCSRRVCFMLTILCKPKTKRSQTPCNIYPGKSQRFDSVDGFDFFQSLFRRRLANRLLKV